MRFAEVTILKFPKWLYCRCLEIRTKIGFLLLACDVSTSMQGWRRSLSWRVREFPGEIPSSPSCGLVADDLQEESTLYFRCSSDSGHFICTLSISLPTPYSRYAGIQSVTVHSRRGANGPKPRLEGLFPAGGVPVSILDCRIGISIYWFWVRVTKVSESVIIHTWICVFCSYGVCSVFMPAVLFVQTWNSRRQQGNAAAQDPGEVKVQGRQDADGRDRGIHRQLAAALHHLASGEILRPGENHRKSPLYLRDFHAYSAMARCVQFLHEPGGIRVFQQALPAGLLTAASLEKLLLADSIRDRLPVDAEADGADTDAPLSVAIYASAALARTGASKNSRQTAAPPGWSVACSSVCEQV